MNIYEDQLRVDEEDLCFTCAYQANCPLTVAIINNIVELPDPIQVQGCKFYKKRFKVLEGGLKE